MQSLALWTALSVCLHSAAEACSGNFVEVSLNFYNMMHTEWNMVVVCMLFLKCINVLHFFACHYVLSGLYYL